MMPCKYIALNGLVLELDLDSVFDIARGHSSHRTNWSATIVYESQSGSFVELRDSPQDYRGNSDSEAEEVSEKYLLDTYGLNPVEITAVRAKPSEWKWIDRR